MKGPTRCNGWLFLAQYCGKYCGKYPPNYRMLFFISRREFYVRPDFVRAIFSSRGARLFSIRVEIYARLAIKVYTLMLKVDYFLVAGWQIGTVIIQNGRISLVNLI